MIDFIKCYKINVIDSLVFVARKGILKISKFDDFVYHKFDMELYRLTGIQRLEPYFT